MFSRGKATQHWAEIMLILYIQDFNSNSKEIIYCSTYDSLCLTYLDNQILIW